MKPLATLALALLPGLAAAQTYTLGEVRIAVPVQPGYEACLDRSGGGDLAMMACTDQAAAAWDRRLNAAYGRLRALLPREDFAAVQAAQRGWLAYRDGECRDSGQDGTMGRLAAASCVLRLTAIRAAELEERVRQARP